MSESFADDEHFCSECGKWRKKCKLLEEHCAMKFGEEACYEI